MTILCLLYERGVLSHVLQPTSYAATVLQVEIDEYRDYEKASGALKEALKQLIKANSRGNLDGQVSAMERRIDMLEKFVEARRVADKDPEQMVMIDLLFRLSLILLFASNTCSFTGIVLKLYWWID